MDLPVIHNNLLLLSDTQTSPSSVHMSKLRLREVRIIYSRSNVIGGMADSRIQVCLNPDSEVVPVVTNDKSETSCPRGPSLLLLRQK